MEVPGGHANKLTVCLYEMIGTAFLLVGINLSRNLGAGSFQPVGVGLTLFGNIIMFGAISGGHFNPAVTLGVLIREGPKKIRTNFTFAFMIIAFQLIGATLGCLFVAFFNKKDPVAHTMYPGIAMLCPVIDEYMVPANPLLLCDATGLYYQLFITEAVTTFIFVNVILNVKYHVGA